MGAGASAEGGEGGGDGAGVASTGVTEPPSFLLCPITQELMHDPVIVEGGFTFERNAIEDWLRNNTTNPMTGETLSNTGLAPNFAIREACAAFRAQRPDNAASVARYEKAAHDAGQAIEIQTKKIAQLKEASVLNRPQRHQMVSNSTTSASSPPSWVTKSSPGPRPAQSEVADEPPAWVTASASQASSAASSATNGSQHILNTNVKRTSYTSSGSTTSSPGAGASRCALCSAAAVSRAKVGDEWLAVCDSCSSLVKQQQQLQEAQNFGSIKRRSTFTALSAVDAAKHALDSIDSLGAGMSVQTSPTVRQNRSASLRSFSTSATNNTPNAISQSTSLRSLSVQDPQTFRGDLRNVERREWRSASANNADHIANRINRMYSSGN